MMNMKTENLTPAMAIHPGEILKDEISFREITQKEFAIEIGIAYTQLNEIINGKRNITSDFAVLLETALDIDAQYWLSLQSLYEIDKSRIKEKIIEKTKMIEEWKIYNKKRSVKRHPESQLITK